MYKNIKNVSKVVFGRGCFSQLDGILSEKRVKVGSFMVFIVDDVFKSSKLKERIPVKKKDMLIWVNVDVEPKTGVVDALTQRIKKSSPELPACVIGIGGGSAMDYAKAISVMLTNPGSSVNYQGLNLVKNPSVYHVGIPTISGTGAEVSTTAVLTGPKKKLGIKSDYTPFDQVVLDPDLIDDVPADQRFYTGMDCYVHNIESLNGTLSNTFSAAYSQKSLELCREIFLDENSRSPQANEKLMVASYLGGLSLSYSEVGACHALSYGLSFILGLRHGIAICITFNHLEEYYPQAVEEFHIMLKKNRIIIPKNVADDLNLEQVDKMVDLSLGLDHMWNHAIGKNWKQIITRDTLKELYYEILQIDH